MIELLSEEPKAYRGRKYNLANRLFQCLIRGNIFRLLWCNRYCVYNY